MPPGRDNQKRGLSLPCRHDRRDGSEKMRDILTRLSCQEDKPFRFIYETDDSLILVNASVMEGISVGCTFIPREAARNCPMARPLSFNGI